MYVASIFCLALVFSGVSSNQDYDLNGKIAVVTGGAKGIGYAIADNYLKNGVRTVVIVDKNRSRGAEAEASLNKIYGIKKAVFIYGDVTKDLIRVSKIIFLTFGCIDILVNNAGILNECDPTATIMTNTLAPALWSQIFFENMRKDKGGKGGTIMNVASVSAYYRDPFFWFYKSSKYGILGLTFGMGHEYNYMITGVRVYAICPGLTTTDLSMHPKILAEPVDIYNKYIENVTSQAADVVGQAAAILYKTGVTGTAYTVEDGGLPVVSPDRADITLEDILNLK